MTKDNRKSMLKKIYGENIGLVQNSKPIMIENPEFLKLTQNGNDSDAMETESAPRVNGNSKLTPSFPKRGPTDKQLEMMTSDGRRRITPIFILPDAEQTVNTTAMNGNSCESFGKNQMQSSSSGAKSKIVIEKLDGIVEPNVSPGKKSGSPVSDNSASQPSSSPAPKTNRIAIKHKPGPINNTNPALNSSTAKVNGTASVTASDSSDSQARAPPVNMIQVKKAPGKPPADPPAKKTEDSVSTSGQQVKKKINRIDSSSSESDSSDSDSSSSSSDDETTSQTSKSGADTDRAGQESSKAKPKPDKPAAKPPTILNNKRKIEDSGSAGPAKKRGRPPGSVSGTSTPVKTPVTAPATAAPATPAATPAVSAATKAAPSSGGSVSLAPSLSVPGLPPLSLNNNRANVNYSQHRVGSSLLNMFVQNDFHRTSLGSLHKVSSHEGPSLESPLVWDLMLPAPVTAVLSSPHHLLLTCRDATLHLLSTTGARALPPAVFPAPPHRLTVSPCGQRLVCVTTTARLFLWDLTLTPRVVLKNEDIGPLSRINKRVSITITKITFNSEKLPILSLR